jgi:hypothetical protein
MAEGEGRERRRVERRSIPGIEATCRSPGDVRVIDVSLYGMSIETAGDLEVGRSLCLEVRHGKHRANVEVAVRWQSACRVERARNALLPVWRAGVEFVDVYRESNGGIWDWVMVPGSAQGT